MNTEFYRLIGSLEAVTHFIETQKHDPKSGKHDRGRDPKTEQQTEIKEKLKTLKDISKDLLDEQAKISHAVFDFRRILSKNAESFYHTINYLRRKAPEWQIMDEDLLQLIENYQATASSLFFGGDGEGSKNPGGSGSSSGSR